MNGPVILGRPVRVLYLVPDLGVGGAERHVTTLMPRLDPERFEASVICIGVEGALFADLESTGVQAKALHRTKRQALGALRDLIREIRNLSPDVVITRGYNAETLGRIAARIAGVPTSVVWVHNHGDITPRGLVRRITDRLLGLITDAYYGVAEAQREYLVDELGLPENKITIIHNGVDPDDYETGEDRSALTGLGLENAAAVVGILAAFRPEKDHRLFIRAAQQVLAERPEVRFVLAGDGPERPAVEQLVAEAGMSERIVFAGNRSDVPALLRALDVFVLSSYSIECFPMALLEAMAAGRPAVCTDVGGIKEMIVDGETGFLIPPHDATALASGLLRILGDSGLRTQMGHAARYRVETRFSLQASVAATETALEQLVRDRSARRHIRRAAGPDDSRSEPLVLTVVLDLTFVGGVEVLLLRLFEQFDPALVRPRIVCLREAGPLAAEFTAAGFEVRVLRRRDRLGLLRFGDLVADLRRSRTDVVLVAHHHRAALLLGRLAARAVGAGSVLAAHDMDLTQIGKRVLPRWAVASLWLSDVLVLLSPSQGDYLRREEGVGRRWASTVREVVVPNGIELPAANRQAQREAVRAELGLDSDDFAVGIVARLSAQKAHQVLFTAVAELQQTHPQVRLLVIGGGERRAELRTLAAELGIASRTRFLGVRRDVDRLLSALDVTCLSSVHEGAPVGVLESMAAEVPVVATDCGALRDLVGDGEHGFIVRVGDSTALAQRLATLAADPELRARLGRQGRERVEREFRIADTARRYEEVFCELVQRKGRQTS